MLIALGAAPRLIQVKRAAAPSASRPSRTRDKVMMRMRRFLLAATIVITAAGVAQAADPTAGAAVFKTQCSICHSPVEGKNMIGPSLFGIVNRKAGQVPGFRYSVANRDSGLTWDEPTLDRYLISPQAVVPKTIMTYAGLKDETKRGDLIAYLATLH
jgi:cytochrome c